MLKSCRKDGVLVAGNLFWIMVKIGCWKDWKTGKTKKESEEFMKNMKKTLSVMKNNEEQALDP